MPTAILYGLITGAVLMAVSSGYGCHRIWRIYANSAVSWYHHARIYRDRCERCRRVDWSHLDAQTIEFMESCILSDKDAEIRCLEWAKYFEAQVPLAVRKWYVRYE